MRGMIGGVMGPVGDSGTRGAPSSEGMVGGMAVALHGTDDAVVLTVSDTGVGIPAPELPLVFDRFHRVPGALGRNREGTGIGLALVRELIGLHGGSVSVTSAPGVG